MTSNNNSNSNNLNNKNITKEELNNLSLIKNNSGRLNKLNLKRRPDGSIYRSRIDMINDYKNSVLIYPFSVIYNIDYCRSILKTHFKNCFYFSIPFTFVLGYALNPTVRSEGMQFRKHYKFYFFIYFSVNILIFTLLSLDSLIFCDYCKPWSKIYSLKSDSDEYFNYMKERVKTETNSIDVMKKKISTKGLDDEDI